MEIMSIVFSIDELTKELANYCKRYNCSTMALSYSNKKDFKSKEVWSKYKNGRWIIYLVKNEDGEEVIKIKPYELHCQDYLNCK